jgi:hypothetical protein
LLNENLGLRSDASLNKSDLSKIIIRSGVNDSVAAQNFSNGRRAVVRSVKNKKELFQNFKEQNYTGLEKNEAKTLLIKKIDIVIYAIRDSEVFISTSNNSRFLHSAGRSQLNHQSIKLPDSVLHRNADRQIIEFAHIKKFYMGVSFALLLSHAGSEWPKQPGYEAGILFGFKPLKKLSIQTGLTYSQHYCTIGKDDVGKVLNIFFWPPLYSFDHTDCKRSVIGIPIQLNYYILQNSHKSLFCSAGLSSYVDLKYDYNIFLDSSGHIRSPHKSYKTKQLLASSVNIGLGYENHLKIGTIRVEPYIQIPLYKKSLDPRISSIGLRVGMNWRIF